MKVSIIGGGVMGLMSAWRLAQVGYRITVYERHRCGAGASGAALGSLVPYPPHREGEEIPTLQRATLKKYPTFIQELEEASGHLCGYRPLPRLMLCMLSNHRQRAEKCRTLEPGVFEELPEQELENLLPGANFPPFGAFICRDTAVVDTSKTILALKQACLKSGVTVLENTLVEDVSPLLKEGKVLLVAGAWSEELCPQLSALCPVDPVRGQVLRARYRGELNHMIRAGKLYIQPEEEGTILIGSTKEKVGLKSLPVKENFESLFAEAQAVLPRLKHDDVVATWSGLRPTSTTGSFFIGPVPEVTNLYAAVGFGGIGWCLAPWAGKEVARMIKS